jgi:hypothetical protein
MQETEYKMSIIFADDEIEKVVSMCCKYNAHGMCSVTCYCVCHRSNKDAQNEEAGHAI